MDAYLRLKVRELLKEAGTNLHKAMQVGGFSYPTMHRYMAYPDQVESLHTPSVLALLINALGWTPAEIEAMPVGHFFEVVTDGEREEPDWLRIFTRLGEINLVHVRQIDDPILTELSDTMMDRLAWLESHDGDPVDPAELRAYMADLLEDRIMAWARIGAERMGDDEELANLTQLVLARLNELRSESSEASPDQQETTDRQ